jgi:TonB family protein
MPFYPPIARVARIEGKVLIRAIVNDQGDTSEVEALSGPPLLKAVTIEYVKNWKFGWPNPCSCRVNREIVFVYKLSGKTETPKSPTTVVRWFGKSRVEIEADFAPINTDTSY